ncbi:MAG: tyrosine-type recombinase/integrase, partial [Oscillospiraceae bacterium]|nr:tyrosine-type recombinase/integrase [Oscillospiraceae bacterium]
KKIEARHKDEIKDLHPHKLRHTSASVLLTNGADIVSTSARLGHSNTDITLKMYAHANPESIRVAGQVGRDALRRAKEQERLQKKSV